MSNNSAAPMEIETIKIDNDEQKMSILRRHEETTNSTSQMIDEMRKKFEEKMRVLEKQRIIA